MKRGDRALWGHIQVILDSEPYVPLGGGAILVLVRHADNPGGRSFPVHVEGVKVQEPPLSLAGHDPSAPPAGAVVARVQLRRKAGPRGPTARPTERKRSR